MKPFVCVQNNWKKKNKIFNTSNACTDLNIGGGGLLKPVPLVLSFTEIRLFFNECKHLSAFICYYSKKRAIPCAMRFTDFPLISMTKIGIVL